MYMYTGLTCQRKVHTYTVKVARAEMLLVFYKTILLINIVLAKYKSYFS